MRLDFVFLTEGSRNTNACFFLKDTNISNHLYIFLKQYFLCGGACVHSVLMKVRGELVEVVPFHHMGLRD